MALNESGRLKKLIEEKAILRGEFDLASGKKSGIYFDLRKVTMDPQGIDLIGRIICDMLEDDVAAVGGLETGAIPVAAGVLQKCAENKRDVQGFYVRKKQKGHGTKVRVEGNLPAGGKVVVVEDVTTTGGSALQAVRAVRDSGCEVDTLITILDRGEGAKENLRKEGVKLIPIFGISDF
ncbi:MAG: orotate phosphoribosyltransferase [Candidatus Altiarchaeales archaeon WOR_SM1_86-2]|nr:MAG: orotate phosphoribosyltransferase [Candidatus Altiarchaeales archaeon WOR_SM1_79]ODS36477.1 MAG: orotate phosphoribosyltransferase [Candidatus Altiarchaeales archaeon WOR_SM1_86-2]